MADISEHPNWIALRAELLHIAKMSGATEVYVLDAWGNLWCSAHRAAEATLLRAVAVVESALRALKRPLARGGTIDQVLDLDETHGYIRSFAGVYVVLVLFGGPPGNRNRPVSRGIVGRALPRIEALTIGLPPPDGSGSSSGEAFGVA
jgi:hypothetical protein